MATGESIARASGVRETDMAHPGQVHHQLRRLRLERDLAIAARERLAAERIVLRCLAQSRRRR